MTNNYTCYHLHTEDSLLDSCTNYKLYIDKAVELGQNAIGFSEHGNCYNWIEKKMYANSKGLKFIYECEVYLTEKLSLEDDVRIRDNYHTILVAKNEDGRKELNTLIDLSTQPDHFYYKPRITFDEFFAISDNIIKISACLASPLSKYPSKEDADRNVYERLLKSYDYYEVQPHINSIEQIKYNQMLLKASKQYNIPLIAGTDTHSLNQYKAECRAILQKGKNIEFSNEDEYDLTYKSYDELVEMFRQQGSLPMEEVLQAIENTNVMADSVEDFELDTSFKYPRVENEEKELKERINRMYKEKIDKGIIKPDPRYKEMVKEEMRVFKKIDMVGFMLFMSKITCWCWDNDIPLGFCRGSVGGSMIAYLTDIIDVNPLTWGTMFSRFANEDRKEIGDIDLDISPTQRQLVYDHIIEEYGLDKTAYVLAIGTIAEKGAIDDIARALGYIWADNHNINRKDAASDKNNPYSLAMASKIKEEYEADPEETKKKYPELFYYFDGLVGTAVSQSMHPAGIIVSPLSLPDNYGTFWNDGKRILSINMEEIHEVSLVKYDLLGLKNIEIIKDCCKLAGIKYPKSHEINWEDKKVWEHITDSPVGIFQFESKFAYESMKKMGCICVNDLSLVNASIRPSGESYRDRLLAREWNKNPSEIIDKLLEPNHGFLVFQEDTIKFLTEICGLQGSDADNIRRAIGRKQKDRLEAALPSILEGYCNKSNKPRREAEAEAKEFLQIIEDSANYQFGYNHSTGYSMIGYMCGYLRYYYPTEFITSYLNNANNDDDINDGTALAKTMGIKIIPIKFRHSLAKYSCDASTKSIYKGIESIKFCNEQIANELYELRDKEYNSFIDVLVDIQNTTVNSRQLDILIKLNFFEEFGNPNYLLKIVEWFNNIYDKKQFRKDKLNQLGIDFDLAAKYAEKVTEKTVSGINTYGLLNEIVNCLSYITTSTKDYLIYESECLGYVTYNDESIDNHLFFIINIDIGKSLSRVYVHEIKSGKDRELKIWTNAMIKNPISKNSILFINKVDKKNKRRASGEINEKTGKQIWVDVPDEYEYWLSSYYVKEE